MELLGQEAILDFRRSLLDWFRATRRALPWRSERSVYRTVVSELMCQQTQIDTVLPYFDRWMRAFPDFASLASADPDRVLKLWEGLGYYSRARNLQRLAREVVGRGDTPDTAAGWQALPGIGPYTAAAIASIHHGEAVAVVDGNVIRVCARLVAEERSFRNAGEARKVLAEVAQALLDPEHPGEHNEAMMELGALICRKAKPSCLMCPVRGHCVARGRGIEAQLPRLQRARTVAQEVDRLWIECDGELLLFQVPDGASQLQGLYELPEPGAAGLDGGGCLLATEKRGIGNRRITERILWRKATAADLQRVRTSDALLWASVDALEQLPLSGPHRKWIGKHRQDRR